MSRVFSLDKTSTRVASSMAKNYCGPSSSQQRTQQQKMKESMMFDHVKASKNKPRNDRMTMHLTINPTSNATL